MTKFRVSDYNGAAIATEFDWTGRMVKFTASLPDATVDADKRWCRLQVHTSAGTIDLSGLLK